MAGGRTQAGPRDVGVEGMQQSIWHVDASRSAPDGPHIEKNVERCRGGDHLAGGTRGTAFAP